MTTDGLLDAVAADLTALESALLDTLRVMQIPDPAFRAALAAVHAGLPDLPPGPAAQLLRIRALVLDASLAWCGSSDARTALAGLDEAVTLCHELIGPGGDLATAAADRAVEACTDAAMVCLAQADIAGAQVRLRRADAICQTCDVRPVLRLDLMNVWTLVDFAHGQMTQALRRAETAVELGRAVGGESMLSAVRNLAQACRYLGDLDRALALYGQILDHPARTQAQDQLARLGQAVTTALLDPPRAVPLLLDVVARSQHEQGGESLAHAAATLGSIAQADGQVDVARDWYTVAAGATAAPAVVAGSYALLAKTLPHDPGRAEQLRDAARRAARAESVELAVTFDFITSRDQLADAFSESALSLALTAALVMDVWRIDLPQNLRQSWQQVGRASGTGTVVRLAHDRGRHDLVAALAAHRCAIVPPRLTGDDPRPPRVLVGGEDPLAEMAWTAVERYGRPFRDEARTSEACTSTDGLDLVAAEPGDVYLCWRRPTGRMHSIRVPHDRLDAPLAELARASRAALSSPPTSQPVRPSGLLHWPTEVDLMRRLGQQLLPPELVTDLELTARGVGRLRVRADGDLAQVPWGLLVVPADSSQNCPSPAGPTGPDARPPDTRLVELVDVVTLAPFGLPVRAAPGIALSDTVPSDAPPSDTVPSDTAPSDTPPSDAPTDGVVAVLDPRVPGFPADSALGSVLGRMPAGSALERRLRTYLDSGRLVGQPAPEPAGPSAGMFRRRDQDRAWLTEALATRPARLLYLGHVSTVALTDGVTSEPALHLCCSAAGPGNAAPLGAHRPLAASDILADDSRWPARVALIACASGDDARTRDAYGLVHAVLCRGAELVTGLLWPLPTGQWFTELGRSAEAGVDQDAPGADPLVALTLAVDRAHASADPVHWLCQWQRHRLHRWRSGQNPFDSPISWGGLHTVVPVRGQDG
ncbi:MAG: tetratricopeptide repeat protein [Micrococcales bacterium]|nr:tetratricopeptide repeat protein [Micrococcales bacterium]